MSCIRISNFDSLIYVLVSRVFHNVHFWYLEAWKCDFWSFVNTSYYVNDFGYTCFGIINICKEHLFVNVNSVCWSSNAWIPHLKSSIKMPIGDSLIYLLVSLVFSNVHFRHFGDLKMRFLLIRQQVFLIQWFWIYFCWD